MDLSFGVQLGAVDFLAREGRTLSNAVHLLPPEVDDRVARTKLASLGARIDVPSAAQRKFLDDWHVTGRRAATDGAAT